MTTSSGWLGPQSRGLTKKGLQLSLQILENPHRHHYVKARVRVHEHPEGDLAMFHGPLCIGRYRADGSLAEEARQSAA